MVLNVLLQTVRTELHKNSTLSTGSRRPPRNRRLPAERPVSGGTLWKPKDNGLDKRNVS